MLALPLFGIFFLLSLASSCLYVCFNIPTKIFSRLEIQPEEKKDDSFLAERRERGGWEKRAFRRRSVGGANLLCIERSFDQICMICGMSEFLAFRSLAWNPVTILNSFFDKVSTLVKLQSWPILIRKWKSLKYIDVIAILLCNSL